MKSSMADPLHVLAARLQQAFDTVAGRTGVDPVVRPSDRADAQANGALPLAKALGRNPREIGQAVLDTVELDGVAVVELAGPGFINLTFEPVFIGGLVADVAADDRSRHRPDDCARTRRRRLLGAQRGQGDAHRAPPHDGDR